MKLRKIANKSDAWTQSDIIDAKGWTSGVLSDRFAHIYTFDEERLYLGPGFWKPDAPGYYWIYGVLVHQASHYPSVLGTGRSTLYGRDHARFIAEGDPERARTLAENWEYFVETSFE